MSHSTRDTSKQANIISSPATFTYMWLNLEIFVLAHGGGVGTVTPIHFMITSCTCANVAGPLIVSASIINL